MTWRAIAIGLYVCTSVLLWPGVSQGVPVGEPDPDALCDEETVYGTVVLIDEEIGVFGLLGTKYKFQSMEEIDLEFLQGRMVKIDIGRDCGIQDIRVLDGESESIT